LITTNSGFSAEAAGAAAGAPVATVVGVAGAAHAARIMLATVKIIMNRDIFFTDSPPKDCLSRVYVANTFIRHFYYAFVITITSL
jgi:hypothetical protein